MDQPLISRATQNPKTWTLINDLGIIMFNSLYNNELTA